MPSMHEGRLGMSALPEKWSIPLGLGFSVIPVEPRGKKPMGEWKSFMTHAADDETVARWAANDTNVGIITGKVSNLVVLDFDNELAEAEAKRRGLPETVTVKTSRGRHYYYSHPGRAVLKPKAFPAGMDIQSDHKFVVGPGSIHPDGSVYEWENDPAVYPLAGIPEWVLEPPLGACTKPVGERDDDQGSWVTPKTLGELSDALSVIDADEYHLWVRMGMALKTIPNDKGKSLWLDWSAKSVKFDAAYAFNKWESFKPANTHWKTVFIEAQENWGWPNPRASKRNEAPSPKGRTPIDLGNVPDFHPNEFILDGFMPVGVSVVAGAWGAGKSTNLVPLMASVAHLAPESWGFRPDLRRHVIWITEAPEQARDTLLSLHKAEGSAGWSEFRGWFHLFSAIRQGVKDTTDQLKDLVTRLTWTTETGFRVKPVVVLDTTTANIALENESDNSQVGAAMSALKQSLPATPIVLIGHTPKALLNAEVEAVTFRGAGAWEAEAAATYFLVHDAVADMRFMAIRKARFTPTYREVRFDHQSGTALIDTPWGEQQAKTYLHGVPTKTNGEARRAARQEVREERRAEKNTLRENERQERVLATIRQFVAEGRLPKRNAIHEAVRGDKTQFYKAVDALIAADLIYAHPLSKDDIDAMGLNLKAPWGEALIPVEVAFPQFLDRVNESQQ